MPSWKKVITSGSQAELAGVTGSFSGSFVGDGSGLTGVAGGGGSIFAATGSYQSTTNDLQITGSLQIYKSGSTVFNIEGSQGTLFSVTDELSGSLFSVNDISGIPIFEVFSDDTVKIGTYNAEAIIVDGSNTTISNTTISPSGNDTYFQNAAGVISLGDPNALGNVSRLIIDDTNRLVHITPNLRVDSNSLFYGNITASMDFSSSADVIAANYYGDGSNLTGIFTLANDADNRIITATGTNSGNGESNFTYDGTTVTVTGGNVNIGRALAVGGITPSGTTGRIDASNDIVAYSSSDKRWKTDIKILSSPIEKLQKLSGVEFDWIEDKELHGNKGHDVGVIAQEVEEVLPEAVQTRDSGMKAVRYEKLIPLLIETIKEQQKQIDELKNKIG